MDLAKWSIENYVFMLVLIAVIIIGGVNSYRELGRLEDPEFTIKDALVVTYYPGASPQEVEEEVTETIETAIQELGQLDEIESISKNGISIITATIKDKYDKHTLPQVWDELRRKVNDAQGKLPPGALPSTVVDDFGDVYGVLLAIDGQGYTYKELYEIADFLKTELLQVKDVAKIIMWGEQQEQIYVEISRSRMAQLGISLDQIYKTLEYQNLVSSAGHIRVGEEYIRLNPTGEINSIEEISNLLIRGVDPNQMIYLKDIADVKRGYIDPPVKLLRYDGNAAIALGISTVQGGNVITMGNGLKEKLKQLAPQIPLGVDIQSIYFQADGVEKSVNAFVVNLMQAIAIVIGVLMIFMGLRSGILIGAVLLITVCATLIVMNIYNIDLQRISLGALIIALGMLVDNAIVVTEGMLVRMQAGMDKIKAASEVVKSTQWPLLGATVIAILAFAAIGLSPDSTGEYLRSLFQVMLISLGLSWLIAITITPLLCTLILKPGTSDTQIDPYQGWLFVVYRRFLQLCIRIRYLTVVGVAVLMVLAMIGFNKLEDSFFPDSTNEQFMVHYWLPEGTDIRQTSADLQNIEKMILEKNDVKSVATFVGEGAPRFMLVYSPEKSYRSYGLLLVTVNDYRKIQPLIDEIRVYLRDNYPSANPKFEKIRLGPGGGYNIEARFSGSDPDTLRELSDQVKNIMRSDGNVYSIRDDWRERVKVIRPQFAEAQARRAGVSRAELSEALATTFDGTRVGLYRENNDLIPIVSRSPHAERNVADDMHNVLIWSRTARKVVPLRQVVSGFETNWEDAVVSRRDKRRTITAQGDQITGNASVVFERIQPKIEAIKLPLGYSFEWGGEYENSKDAKAGLAGSIPVTLLVMILISIMLFNAIRQALIIWITVPLAIIGVTVGLLLTNQSFGFMALLGFLSLVGMLIKNAIVLIDEIDQEIYAGKEKYDAIIYSSVSRLRPVSMAALTTILGMIPLLKDVFFLQMAITIMCGLAFATLLTMIFVPVLYSIFFNIKGDKYAQ